MLSVQTEILEQTRLVENHGWIARVRPPTHPWNGRIILLLHGWTGNENSMWFFSGKLPVHSWMVAPRGPLTCPDGGYAWGIAVKGQRPDTNQFLLQADRLIKQLPHWVPEFTPQSRLDIIGFSQGAAMTYTMCLKASPVKIAPLAGYLPGGFEELSASVDFSGLQVYISHNSDDEMVPVEESQRACDLFQSKGASVVFSRNTGGHKLRAKNLQEMNEFFRD